MIRLNPTITHDAAWWDRMYAEGKGQRWTIWGDSELVKASLRFIKKYPRQRSHYLDSEAIMIVASGVGHAAKALMSSRNSDWILYGIDFASYLSGNEHLCIDALLHDLNVYPWPDNDNFFDFAICSEILESLDDPAAAVRECQRIARRTMITLPISMDLLSEGHKWLFDRSDAELLLPGCEVVELRGGKLLACFQR